MDEKHKTTDVLNATAKYLMDTNVKDELSRCAFELRQHLLGRERVDERAQDIDIAARDQSQIASISMPRVGGRESLQPVLETRTSSNAYPEEAMVGGSSLFDTLYSSETE